MFGLIRALIPLALALAALLATLLQVVHAQTPQGAVPAHARAQAPAQVSAHAPTPREPIRMPTPQEIEAQRDLMPMLPSVSTPSGSGGNARPAPIDIAGMAEAFERARSTRTDAAETHSGREIAGLLVFVSFSMPRASLDSLVAQAERMGARLVLRGLIDRSMRRTAEAVREVVGQRRVGWTIDPQAFERFAVSAVPTVVLVDERQPARLGCGVQSSVDPAAAAAASTVGQCDTPAFAKVMGDVSLDHALGAIARDAPAWAPLASAYLARERARDPARAGAGQGRGHR